MRSIFSLDTLAVVVATCCAVALLYVVPQNFDFLNPLTQALGDFDVTDMVFTQFRDEEAIAVDTSIVVVNIGERNRAEIAHIINRINAEGPAVVGVDAFFRQPKEQDPNGDSLLQLALEGTDKLVMVSKVAFKEESKEGIVEQWTRSEVDEDRRFDTLETSHPMFAATAKLGFANLIIDQETAFMTVRQVSLQEECASKTEYSFPIQVVQAVNPRAASVALARHNSSEVVNYRGGLEKFYSLDADQIEDPEVDISVVAGKIVLLGYLGSRIGSKSFDDNFYTPCNRSYVGRSYPDMYGVVIHANVVSMILHESFVDAMPLWLGIMIAIALITVNVVVFNTLQHKADKWYDTVVLAIQLAQSLGIMYLTVVAFDGLSYKMALTPALIGVFLVGTVHELYGNSLKRIAVASIDRFRIKRASLHQKGRTNAAS